MNARIFVGIGGWSFEPWRQTFYPAGLAASRELEYASRQLTAIEINSTYYSSQKPATFAKWRDATPKGFVFPLKASRFATNRRVLADAGESVQRFIDSGITELGPKLGPIVWQFAPTKRFEARDFAAFLALLPRSHAGVPLRHALDVRHASFACPEYLALARSSGVATVFTESDKHPPIADRTADFIYTRIMRTQSALVQGCTPEQLAGVASSAQVWSEGGTPSGLPLVEPGAAGSSAREPGDVFVFFIGGAKERAPAAAKAVIELLS